MSDSTSNQQDNSSDDQQLFESLISGASRDYRRYIENTLAEAKGTTAAGTTAWNPKTKVDAAMPPMSPTTVQRVEHALMTPEAVVDEPLSSINSDESKPSSSVLAIDVDIHDVEAPPEQSDTPEDSPTASDKTKEAGDPTVTPAPKKKKTPTSMLLANYKWFTEATLMGGGGSPDPKKKNAHLCEAQMVFRQLANVGAKLANLRLGESQTTSSEALAGEDDPDQLYPLERFQLNNAAQTMRCNPYGARDNLLVRSERSLADLGNSRAMAIVKKCIDSVGTSTSLGDQVLFSNTTSRNKKLKQQQMVEAKKSGQELPLQQEETEENATVVPISSNSCVDLSEPALVHVWRSAHDGQRFQLSLQTITDGLTQHLLSLGVFVSVISVAIRYQGRFVTVTWIPPLASAAPLVSGTVGTNAPPISKAVLQLLQSRAGVTNPNSLQAYAGKDGRYYLLPTTVGAFLPENLVNGGREPAAVGGENVTKPTEEGGLLVKTKSGLRKGSQRPPRPELYLRDDVKIVPATASQDGASQRSTTPSASSPATDAIGAASDKGSEKVDASPSPPAAKKKPATADPTIGPDTVGPAAAIKRLVAITKDPKFSLASHPSIDAVGEALHSTGVNLHNMRSIIVNDGAWDTVFAELLAAVAKHKKDIPIKKLKPKLRERFDISRDVVRDLLYVHILGRSVKSLVESSMNAAVCLTRRKVHTEGGDPQQTLVAKIVSANLIVDPFLADFAEGHMATQMQITEQENVHGALDEVMEAKFNIPAGEIVISKISIAIRSAAVDLACRKLNLIFDKDAKRAMSFDNLPRIIGVTTANPPLQVKKAEKFEERMATVKARVYKGIQATDISEKFLLTQTATVTLGIVARMMISSIEQTPNSSSPTAAAPSTPHETVGDAAKKQFELERAEIHKVLKRIISIGINIDTGRRDAVVMSIPYLVSAYGTCVAVQYTAGITAILTAVMHRLDKVYASAASLLTSASYSPLSTPTPIAIPADTNVHKDADANKKDESLPLSALASTDPTEFAHYVPPADRAVISACFTELSTGFSITATSQKATRFVSSTNSQPGNEEIEADDTARLEMASMLARRIIALLVSSLPLQLPPAASIITANGTKVPEDHNASTRTDLGIKRATSVASMSLLKSPHRTRPGTASVRFLSPVIPSVVHFMSIEIVINITNELLRVGNNLNGSGKHSDKSYALPPETIIALQDLVRDAPHISKAQREQLIIALKRSSTVDALGAPLEQVIHYFATQSTAKHLTIEQIVSKMKEANASELPAEVLDRLDPKATIQQHTPLQRNYIFLAATHLSKADLDHVMGYKSKNNSTTGDDAEDDLNVFSGNGTFLFKWDRINEAEALAEQLADKWYEAIQGPRDPLANATNPISKVYPPIQQPSELLSGPSSFRGSPVNRSEGKHDGFGPSLNEALKRKSMVRLVSYTGGRDSATKNLNRSLTFSNEGPSASSNSRIIGGMEIAQSGVYSSDDVNLGATGDFNASAVFTAMVLGNQKEAEPSGTLKPMGTFANLADVIKQYQGKPESDPKRAFVAASSIETFRAMSNYAMTISHTSETTTTEIKDVDGKEVVSVAGVETNVTSKDVAISLWRPHLVADVFEADPQFYSSTVESSEPLEIDEKDVEHPIPLSPKRLRAQPQSQPTTAEPEIIDTVQPKAPVTDEEIIAQAYNDNFASLNPMLMPKYKNVGMADISSPIRQFPPRGGHHDYDLSSIDERATRQKYLHDSNWSIFLQQKAEEVDATTRARSDLRPDTCVALEAKKAATAIKVFVSDLADLIDSEFKPEVVEQVNISRPPVMGPPSSGDEELILYSTVLLQLHKAYGQKLRVEHRWNSYFAFDSVDIGKYCAANDSANGPGLVPYVDVMDNRPVTASNKSSPTKDKLISTQKQLLSLDDDLFDVNEAADNLLSSPQRFIRPLLVSGQPSFDTEVSSPIAPAVPSGDLPLRLPGTFYQHSFLIEFVALERSWSDNSLLEEESRMLVEHKFVAGLVEMLERVELKSILATAKSNKAFALIASEEHNNKATQTVDEDEQFLLAEEEKKRKRQLEQEQGFKEDKEGPTIVHPPVSDFVLPTMRLTKAGIEKNNSSNYTIEDQNSVAVQTMAPYNQSPIKLIENDNDVNRQETSATVAASSIPTVAPPAPSIVLMSANRSLVPKASTSTTIVSKKKLAVKGAREDTLQSPVAAANTEPPVYVPTKLQSEIEADKAAARRKLREGAPHLFPHSEHDDRLDAVLVGASLSTGASASSALAVADVDSKSVQVMEQREDIQPAATKRQQGILLPPVILHAKLPPKPDEAFFHRNVPSASPPSTYVPLIATYPPPLDNSRNTVSDVSASANYQQHYHPKVAFTPSKASPASPNNQGAPSHQHGIALPPVLSRTSPASTPFSSPVKIGSPNALIALSPSTVLKEIRRSASLPREAAELQAQPTDAILQPEAVVVKSATAHSSPLAAPVAEVKQETTAIKPVDPNYTPFPLNKIEVHRSVTAEQQRLNTAGTKERNIVEAKYPHFHGTSPSSKPGTPAGKIRPHSLVGQRQTEDNIAATPIVGKIPEPYVRPRSAAEQAIVEAELLAIRNDNVTKLNSAKIELDKAKLELEESERQDSEAAARRVKQQVAQGEQERLKASEKRLALADTLRGIELDMENTVDGERGARKALQIEESNHRDVKLGREYEQMLTEVEALRPLQRLRQKHLEETRLQSGWLLDEIQVRSNQLLIEYRIWYLLNIDLSISYLVTIRQSEKHARGQLQIGASNSLRRIQNAQQMRDQLETLKEKTMAEEAERKRIEKERLDDTTISQQVGSTLADIRRRREQEELAIKRAADAVELLKCERREETARRQQLEYESFCFAIDVVKPIGIIQTEFEERRDFIKNTYEKQFLREWYVDFMLPATAIMHAEERIRTQIVSEMAHNFAQMVTCPASMQAALFAVESNALIAKFGMKQWQEINNSDYIAQLRGKQLTESTANARDTFLSNTNLADKATATVAQSDPAAAGMKAHSYDHFNTVSLHPARYALSQKSQSTAVKSSDNQIVAAPSSPIRAAAVPNSKSISEQEAEERNAIESFHHRMLQEMDLAALKEQQRQQLPSGQREAMRRRNLERLGHTVE